MKKRNALSLRQLLLMATLLLAFSGLTLFLFHFQKDEKLFSNLTSRLFVDEMTSNTLNMHYSLASPASFGIYDYTPTLPAYSAQGNVQAQVTAENTLAALSALKTDRLKNHNAYLCRLLVRSLENSLRLSQYPYYDEPLSPASGMQGQLPILLAEYTFRTRKDVEDYLALLDQTDEYFASLLAYEQEKAAAGLLMPASSLREVREQCDTIVTKEALESGGHFLQVTFRERLDKLCQENLLSLEEAQHYLAQNDRLLKTVLLPAYIALGDGLLLLEDETIPLTGLASRPDGKAYYKALLISQTGSYRPPEEVLQLLSSQFAEEYEALQQLLSSHPEVVNGYLGLESSPFPYTTASQMLADLRGRMEGAFPKLPGEQTSIAVKSVSPSLEDYCAPAFYLTAPLDDTSRNGIYINNKKTPAGLELYTTLAHEGYPGHLYQTVYHNRTALENGANPAWELVWYGGYLEGWALYVEFLSYDYATQLFQEQGRTREALTVQALKHNRSVQLGLYAMLDIMIHYQGLSYKQIVQVLEKFGISDTRAAASIYTYIAQEPCNYLKYYLGYLEILSLQQQARQLWGTEYSDYRFHCFYLDNGPADFLSLKERLAKEG